MPISMKLAGFSQWQRDLKRAQRQAESEVEAEVVRTAEAILASAKGVYVPVVSGELRQSGRVNPPRRSRQVVEVTLGFYAVYALAVHENPRAGKTGGRSPSGRRYRLYATSGAWKFLEQPLSEETAHWLTALAAALGRGLS
jgi:hypothetical protein